MTLCRNIGIASTVSLIAATLFGCSTALEQDELAVNAAKRDTTVLLVGHEVADFDSWYPVFTEVGEPLRISHDASGHRLFRSFDDPNYVNVAVEFPTPEDLFGFVSDPALLDEMTQAGVIVDTVDVVLSEEIEAVAYNKNKYNNNNRDTTILLVGHEVADFDAWYPVFTEVGGPLRLEHGATGHRLFRSLDNPNYVVVHVEFANLDDLHGFVSDPALLDEMTQAGVVVETVNVVFSEAVEWLRYEDDDDDDDDDDGDDDE